MSRAVDARTDSGAFPVARAAFRPDIEGLRALAVVAVIAFHAGIPGWTGGFIGVDIFFVISGFLITGILVREGIRSGRLDFHAFYARRARRILPMASVVLVATMIAAWIVLPPLAVLRAAKDILAAALFFSNWMFIAQGTDYLAQATDHSPVLHYWSLAVEEQFYVVWPVIIIAAIALARRARRNPIRALVLALGAATAASFVASLVQTATDPGLAYMATSTRAWEFGVGGLLAIGVRSALAHPPTGRIINGMVVAVGWAGVAALGVGIASITATTAYPGIAALLPTLGTAAIILAGSLSAIHPLSVSSLLATPVLRFVGRISYSWYLWHWPILVIAEAAWGQLDWPVRTALMGAALALSFATYSWIELPLSTGRPFVTRASSAIALGLVALVAATTSALGLGSFEATQLNAAAASSSTAASFDAVFGADTGARSGAVTPSPLAAVGDVPQPGWCLIDRGPNPGTPCVVGDPAGIDVVLFGDSHAHQWLPALTVIANNRHWKLTVLTKAGCPIAAVPSSALEDKSEYCAQWREHAIQQIVNDIRPTILIISSLASYTGDREVMATGWATTLTALTQSGAAIAYIRDTPKPTQDIPTCVSGALADWSRCAFSLTESLRNEPLIDGSVGARVSTVDLTKYFCTEALCPAVRNSTLLYRDDSHITATAARALAPALDNALVDAGLIRSAASQTSG